MRVSVLAAAPAIAHPLAKILWLEIDMYVPPLFKEDRIDVLHAEIRRTGLATLVTLGTDGLIASHVPMLLDTEPAPYGTLLGHVARPNPQARGTVPAVQALAIFQGPDAYITPSWYATKRETGKVVPTWNYVAIHAYGPVEFFSDTERLRAIVTRLTERQELTAGRSVGGDRRAGGLHRGHAEGHRGFFAADRAAGGQVENEPEPPGAGPRGGCRWAGRGRAGGCGGVDPAVGAFLTPPAIG